MVATEAQLEGERLYRINTPFFERILHRYNKTQPYSSFKEVVGKYAAGRRRLYRYDTPREPQEINVFGKCEDEQDKTIIERPIRALVAYHPLSVDTGEGTIPIDSYFEIWFYRNIGLDTPMNICLDSSVLRMNPKPDYACRAQERTKMKTVEQWNRERIPQSEKRVILFSLDDAVLRTHRDFSRDHSIEESSFWGVNQLLYEIFEGMRGSKVRRNPN